MWDKGGANEEDNKAGDALKRRKPLAKRKMADLLGCICLMGSAKCKRGCATHIDNNNRVNLRNAHFTEHQVPFEDVSQPPEEAMFAFVEQRIDSDRHKIVRLEAWSNGTLRVWIVPF